MTRVLFLCAVFFGPYLLFSHDAKLRIGMFFPVDGTFREIYGSVEPTYEIELTGDFLTAVSTWGNFNLTSMDGYSINGGDRTNIVITNLSFGGKIRRPFKSVQIYGGLGCVLSEIFIRNHNTLCCAKTNKFAVGGVIKLGVEHFITRFLFLDCFLDYYFQPVRFETRRDVGGFRTGVGLGYAF